MVGDTTSVQKVVPFGPARGTFAAISLVDGRSVSLTRTVHVGRGADCELVLDDQAASRLHARIEPTLDGGLYIRDLGSRNGTYVDGRRVSELEITGPAVIRIGDTVLRIAILSDEYAAASAIGPLVGGTALVAVKRALRLVSPTELPVIILGDTGTGKEVVARALHDASGRGGPFVAVNCAALPDSLVESELFGHARGSFTGASTSRRGLFVEANGGTLFLDEVGDLPAVAQAKLLRVLEDKIVRPLGADHEQWVDVRVISATNHDLHARTRAGTFRADLFARLAGVEIKLPPLRSRIEDLPALIRFLWQRAHGRTVDITPNALEALALYAWPHNVRELDHVLRAAALVREGVIEIDSLPPTLRDHLEAVRQATTTVGARIVAAPPATLPPTREMREHVEFALREHSGNVRRVAQRLGIARGHLYRLLKLWELEPATFRPGAGMDSA